MNEYLMPDLARLSPYNQRNLPEAAAVTADQAAAASRTRASVRERFAGLLARRPFLALPVPGGPAGLPASLQLIGPAGSEEQLVGLGRLVEVAVSAR